jgi:hypothetical protein
MRVYDTTIDGENRLLVEGEGYEFILQLDGTIEKVYEERGSSQYLIAEEQVPTEVLEEVKRLAKKQID